MDTPIKPDSFWAIDLPANYSEDGINITNDEDYLSEQGANLVIDNDNVSEIYHGQLTIVNNDGKTKDITIPSDTSIYACFIEQRSILKAKHRVVSYCHSIANWEGLGESKLVTIDIESGELYVQYWAPEWISAMEKEIVSLNGDASHWSNSLHFDISFAANENELIITSDHDGIGEASLRFIWNNEQWELTNVSAIN